MRYIKTSLSLLVLIFTFNISIASNTIEIKDGDKICFIGNSITHGGTYHAFFQTYWATRHPNTKLEFINCGIAGDAASGMLRRFGEDILIHKPNFAFLMTGMNDVGHYLYDVEHVDSTILSNREKAIDNYYSNTEKLTALLLENNIQPIFMTPTIYDQTAKIDATNKNGVNDALALCSDHIKRLAQKHNAPVIDLYSLLNTINLKGQETDSSFTIIGADRVHPKDPGHILMAFEIIKTLQPPAYISYCEINAKSKTVSNSENCSIEFTKNKNVLEFKVLESSLPFPIKEELDETLEFIPYNTKYNKEILRINNLKKGNYKLTIDDSEINSFSSSELLKGINLTNYRNTPQYQQAFKILDLCLEYREIQNKLRVLYMIEFKNLKDYNGDGSIEDKRAFLNAKNETQKGKSWYPYMVKTTNDYFENLPKKESFQEDLKNCRNKIYTINQPKWHVYKIVEE